MYKNNIIKQIFFLLLKWHSSLHSTKKKKGTFTLTNDNEVTAAEPRGSSESSHGGENVRMSAQSDQSGAKSYRVCRPAL